MEDTEFIKQLNEDGYHTKEDIMFEILLTLVAERLKYTIDEYGDIIEANRRAYKLLPFAHELEKE
jgi:hypothetical protein